MVARVVPQSARRRHAESRKPDLRGVVARPKAPVLGSPQYLAYQSREIKAVGPYPGMPGGYGAGRQMRPLFPCFLWRKARILRGILRTPSR